MLQGDGGVPRFTVSPSRLAALARPPSREGLKKGQPSLPFTSRIEPQGRRKRALLIWLPSSVFRSDAKRRD